MPLHSLGWCVPCTLGVKWVSRLLRRWQVAPRTVPARLRGGKCRFLNGLSALPELGDAAVAVADLVNQSAAQSQVPFADISSAVVSAARGGVLSQILLQSVEQVLGVQPATAFTGATAAVATASVGPVVSAAQQPAHVGQFSLLFQTHYTAETLLMVTEMCACAPCALESPPSVCKFSGIG